MTNWELANEVNKKFYSKSIIEKYAKACPRHGAIWITDIKREIATRVLDAANLIGETPGMPGYGYTYFPGPTQQTPPMATLMTTTDMIGIYKKRR